MDKRENITMIIEYCIVVSFGPENLTNIIICIQAENKIQYITF